MKITAFSFGSIETDGVPYEHDVIIDRGQVHKRKKGASKKFREAFAAKATETKPNRVCPPYTQPPLTM